MLTVFWMKGQVLHRARELLKEPGSSSVFVSFVRDKWWF